jgi:hypothetical protein
LSKKHVFSSDKIEGIRRYRHQIYIKPKGLDSSPACRAYRLYWDLKKGRLIEEESGFEVPDELRHSAAELKTLAALPDDAPVESSHKPRELDRLVPWAYRNA